MEFFRNIFEKKSSTNADWIALIDNAQKTAAGITVTPETASRCAPVFAALRIKSETVAQLPCNIFKRKRDGGREKAVDHPLHFLFHDSPNAWTSAFQFICQIERDAMLYGSGYALATTAREKIKELIRLDPSKVVVEIDKITMEPSYKYSDGENSKIYNWQEILHVASFGGQSPIRQCSSAIGLCLAMEQHASQIFRNGGRPSGVVRVPKRMSKPTFDRFKMEWNNNYAGLENGGKTPILEEGIDFQPLTFNSVDLQFMDLRGFQIAEIARCLGVPPVLIADYGRATWSNSEQMAQHFLTFGILPRIKAWEGAISRLLSAKERREYYPEFMVDELVKADIAARFEAYSKAIAARILNPNEARAKENLPAYVGGEEFINPNIEQASVTPKPKAPGLRVVA